MKELDVLLERFFASEFADLEADERTGFQALLELEDPDLYAVLVAGALPADGCQAALAARIHQHRRCI